LYHKILSQQERLVYKIWSEIKATQIVVKYIKILLRNKGIFENPKNKVLSFLKKISTYYLLKLWLKVFKKTLLRNL